MRRKRRGSAAIVGRRSLFLFFSSRLGCVGSLLLSAAVTVLLLVAFGVIRL